MRLQDIWTGPTVDLYMFGGVGGPEPTAPDRPPVCFQPANPCRILRFLYGSSYTRGGLQDWWNGEFNWAAVVPSRAALRAISTVSSVLEDDYGVGPFIALQPCFKRFSAARPCSELR